MEGEVSSNKIDDQVPDAISYHMPSAPSTPLHGQKLTTHLNIPPTPSTPIHDHELRTHRSIYWNGLTGMYSFTLQLISFPYKM